MNTSSKPVQSLESAPKGLKVRVARLDGQPAVCHRLREMGFCEDAEVTVLQNSSAMVCQVCGTRVCLSKQLAGSILVAPQQQAKV